MSTRFYRGRDQVEHLPPDHRGIAYGDGLFETMRVHAGAVHWWPRHWARLVAGAARLRMAPPDAATVQREVEHLCAGQADAVLKLILSRGAAGRGYAPAPAAQPQWQLSLHGLSPAPTRRGLVLRWCETRLSTQPLLAGIKHCNRLEQVLARSEWLQPGAAAVDADEGLMCEEAGHVVCATAANVFVYRRGRWHTPPLDRCGVAGICRGWALAALAAEELRLLPEDVEAADAVFLCNAVRGILPVARVGARRWSAHRATHDAHAALAAAHPAFPVELP